MHDITTSPHTGILSFPPSSEGAEDKQEIEKKSELSLRDRLVATALQTMREIAADNQKRIQESPSDLKALNQGVFYPNQYFLALKKCNETQRLEWLRENGSFYHGKAHSKFFTMKNDPSSPTKAEVMGYQLLPQVSASKALDALKKGLTFLGCGETCNLAYLTAIRNELGNDKFDYLFGAESATPLNLRYCDPKNSLQVLVKTLPLESTVIQKGYIVNISGIGEAYCDKHINGESFSFNTLCSEEGDTIQFIGLGLNPKGCTKLEVTHQLCKDYNDQPIGRGIFSQQAAHIFFDIQNPRAEANATTLKNHQLSLPEFLLKGAGNVIEIVDFNIERITALREASKEEATVLLVNWTAPLPNSMTTLSDLFTQLLNLSKGA